MWLRRKDTDLFSEQFVCDDVRIPHEVKERLETGRWVEHKPMWIQHRSTDEVFFVTHPEHQRRLLREGGRQVEDPHKELVKR